MSRWSLAAFVVAAFLSAAIPALADAPFSFDRAPGRLPKNVKPIAYRIAIVPDGAKLSLTGTETIVLQVRSKTATVQMNSLNERLTDVRFDGAAVAKTVSNDDKQLTTITLAKPASVGRHVLAFAYTGKIETTPDGLFYQPYTTPDGKPGALYSTQFEATDARRMFPCWDEPAFRATFQLTATVPANVATISNMPVQKRTVDGALATVTFGRTPSMPSYLVEFTAGDMAALTGTSGATGIGVWAVKGQEQNGQYALTNAEQILADYNAYFGVNFPLPKLDSIAIPGGFQGAMENWGAITYNDQALLVSPSSTFRDKQEVYAVQAHEMAHQWNGDLVTMGWWDDLWLNESFASWRAAKETAERNPSWNWWEVQDGDKEAAMNADARRTSHPIHVAITNELEAETSFDPEITYAKGQAFLRMLEAYLGPDVFRDGIRSYMKARAYSNATGADLWSALSQRSHQDVGALSSTWIKQPGFPVLSVAASCTAGKRTIAVSQARFLLEGSDPAKTQWDVPLFVRSGVMGPVAKTLMTKRVQSLAAGGCADPLTINAGLLGFYRVAYDAPTLKINMAAFGTLPSADRIALLDDQWALALAGKAPLSTFLTLAGSMGTSNDARAWTQISAALGTLETYERGTSGYAAYLTYARSVLKPLALRLGWDPLPNETPDIGNVRQTVLADLGLWGDPDVIAEARKRFTAYVADRGSLPPNQQQTVLTVVAKNADAATFDQLHEIAKSSKNETELRRNYSALMSMKDDALAKRALDIAMSNEIPPQAATLRLFLLFALNDAHPEMAWTYFKANSDSLLHPFQPMAPMILAQYIPDGFWTAAPLAEIEGYIKPRIPADYTSRLDRGMERARFSVASKGRLDPMVDAFVSR